MRCVLKTLLLALLLLCVGIDAEAKTKKKLTAEEIAMKAREDSIPWMRGFQVRTDLIGLSGYFMGSYTSNEVDLRLNLKDRYFPTVELGYATADKEDDLTMDKFKMKGPFFRVGADYNILKNKHDIYRLYVGARYGYSSFKYDLNDLTEAKATYQWADLVFGTEARIIGPLCLGWDLRYRKRISGKYADNPTPWYVPGFGSEKGTLITGHFNITLNF